MTDFYYNNEEQLMWIREEVFGEKGAIDQSIRDDNLDVYKFLIAMSISYGLKINKKIYDYVKARAMSIDFSVENRVFFEKSEYASKDVLYFEEFMKKAGNDETFRKKCQTFFKRVA